MSNIPPGFEKLFEGITKEPKSDLQIAIDKIKQLQEEITNINKDDRN